MFFQGKVANTHNLIQKHLIAKNQQEFSKQNSHSYDDTLFVKIEHILFSKEIHKDWQFSVSRKYEIDEKYLHSGSVYSILHTSILLFSSFLPTII